MTKYLSEFTEKNFFTKYESKENPPKKPGVYMTALLRFPGNKTVCEYWQKWNGYYWNSPHETPEEASICTNEFGYIDVWCGLTEEGYKYAKSLKD